VRLSPLGSGHDEVDPPAPAIAADEPVVPIRDGHLHPVPLGRLGGRSVLNLTRQIPLRSRDISACAICGGITHAQNASRSIFFAAVLSLPQADEETIFT
jgi:hypothetical protein